MIALPWQYTARTQLQHILYGCAAEQVLAGMEKKVCGCGFGLPFN